MARPIVVLSNIIGEGKTRSASLPLDQAGLWVDRYGCGCAGGRWFNDVRFILGRMFLENVPGITVLRYSTVPEKSAR